MINEESRSKSNQNLWYKFKKRIHGKAPSTEEDPLTAMWESCNHFDKEYYFKLVKSIPEKILNITKVQVEANKY